MDLFLSMKVYRRVVELRSFSGAARDLRLSNAVISKHVAQLEERLSATLLERTTRRLSITPAGTAYYEQCVSILNQVEAAEQSLGTDATTVRGTLRVNAPMGYGLMYIVPRIGELTRTWPELKLDLSLNDRFVDLVEEGVDVAIRISTGLSDSSSLIAHKLGRVRTVVVGSRSYFRKQGVPLHPSELSQHQCIRYSLSPTPNEWAFESGRGVIRVPVQGSLDLNSSLAICSALDAGLGLSQLPLFYVHEALRKKRLREVLSDHPSPSVSIYAVHPRTRHVSSRLRAFLDFMRSVVADAPYLEGKTGRD